MADGEGRITGEGAERADAPFEGLRSRRGLLKIAVAAGAASAGAVSAMDLASSPSGASGSAIDIDSVTVGTAGGVTVLEYPSGSNTLGSQFRAALQDWGGQVFNVRGVRRGR